MIVNSEGNSTLYVDFLGAAVTSPDLIIIFIYNINLLDASITPGHIRSLLLLLFCINVMINSKQILLQNT